MNKVKSFLKTTFLGGFLVVLPIIVLIFVLNWLFDFLTANISPITKLLIQTTKVNEVVAAVIAVTIMLLLFFVVGILVQTRFGKFFFEIFEERLLKRIPIYRIIKETVIQLFGGEKMIFKGVALVKPFNNDTMITAFITDDSIEDYITVFIPSAPAPTGGYIYHIKREYVTKIDYPVEQAMRTVLSLGAGSKDVLKELEVNKK
ncbi:MAG: DUF502 domain-containing protein [Ignavibacteria bacterium]|nr:DUF502 domain-containing protein [Ignavibacteria bacterium]